MAIVERRVLAGLAVAAAFAAALIAAPASQAVGPGSADRIFFGRTLPDPMNLSLNVWQGTWSVNLQGSDLRLWLKDGAEPTFSPDGSRVAYSITVGSGDTDVAVANADGSGSIVIAGGAGMQYQPAWSPDGTRIAYTDDPSGVGSSNAVWVMDPDGQNKLRITPVAGASEPDWSPDSSKLVFSNGGILIRNADGSGGPTTVVPSGQYPSWSPDGKHIVYVAPSAFGATGDFLFTVDPEGTNNAVLTLGAHESRPHWSPDGKKILFRSYDGTFSGFHAYTMPPTPLALPTAIRTPSVAEDEDISAFWGPSAAPPVIFVPGFVASRLRCPAGGGTTELWPNIPRPKLPALTLAADGATDAGDGTCSGPVEAYDVIDSVLSKDIHKPTLAFLNRIAPGANAIYPWDWRKSPEQAVAGLDAAIDALSAAHGGAKVAILAHSMGGLVTRWYLDDPTRAAKVQRALIVATPSWGSPKALFPLATGQETPVPGLGLDLLLNNDDMKVFAQTMTGAYFLYPSANFGTWLTVQGRQPSVLNDRAKLRDYIAGDLHGSGTLLDQALDAHANVLDGWKTNGVQVRALVGAGMNTVVGVDLLPGQTQCSFRPGIPCDPDGAELHFGNGDETVPARSAVQGTPGTADPLGENIPIAYACNTSHVPMAGDAELTAAGAEGFLSGGAALTAATAPCSNGGFSFQVFGVDLAPVIRARKPGRVANRAATLSEAQESGDVDALRFGASSTIVTNDRRPVQLTIPDAAARVVVHRLDGETQGPAQSYGPLPSGLQFTTGADGGLTVAPVAGAAGPAAASPTGPSGAAAAPAGHRDRTPPKLKAAVRIRGGRYVVTLKASDPSGIRRIQYRLGAKAAWRPYRRPLVLRRAQLRTLRIRAADRAGNVSRAAAVRVPARRASH